MQVFCLIKFIKFHVKVFDERKEKIYSLREQIILQFQEINIEERKKIWDIVPANKFVLKFLTYKYEFNDNNEFRDFIILEIFRNLHTDPREIYLYFGFMLEKAKKNKMINIKAVLEELLSLADDTNWCNLGSMKTFLKNVIKYNLD